MTLRTAIGSPGIRALAVLSASFVLGCSASSSEEPAGAEASMEQHSFALTFEMTGGPATACGRAAGVAVRMAPPAGNPLVCTLDDGAPLGACVFVGAPGQWVVEAVDVLGVDQLPLTCCTRNFPTIATVSPAGSNPFEGSLNCAAGAGEPLVVRAWANLPPQVLDVTVEPGATAPRATNLTLSAEALELAGAVDFNWTVIRSPENATFKLTATEATAVFSAQTPGDYLVKVTATDGLGEEKEKRIALYIKTSARRTCPNGQCSPADAGRGYDGDDGYNGDNGDDGYDEGRPIEMKNDASDGDDGSNGADGFFGDDGSNGDDSGDDGDDSNDNGDRPEYVDGVDGYSATDGSNGDDSNDNGTRPDYDRGADGDDGDDGDDSADGPVPCITVIGNDGDDSNDGDRPYDEPTYEDGGNGDYDRDRTREDDNDGSDGGSM